MKIHIIGNVGTGKTHASKIIANKLGYKHIELDLVIFGGDQDNKNKLLNNENIITECTVIDNPIIDEVLNNADIIFLYNISNFKRLYYILKRNIIRTGSQSKTIKHFIKMLRYVLINSDKYIEYKEQLNKMNVKYFEVNSIEEIYNKLNYGAF